MESAFFLEDILKNSESPPPDRKLHSTLIAPRQGTLGSLYDQFMFLWYTSVKPRVYTIVGFVAVVMSVQLVIGEMIILFKFNFSIFDLISMSKLLSYSISILFLLYMSLCIYYGLFNLKLTSYYELHPNQQTDPFSLLYSANFLTKLAPPLCFNFLKIINLNSGTAFHRFLGVQDPIPLIGEDF